MTEKRLFQTVIAIAGLVPLTAGALGVLDPGVLGLYGDRNAISHASYLSGLLFGIGLLGEYVGRIYQEVRRRPRYTIDAVLERPSGETAV